MLKVLDLCGGTQSVRKALTEKYKIKNWINWYDTWFGYKEIADKKEIIQYKSIDIFSPNDENIIIDLASPYTLEMVKSRLGNWKPDFIWASPTCTAWSIAAISHHWKVEYEGKVIVKRIPTSKMAKISVVMVNNIRKIIEHYGVPFAIENPRGTLRKNPVFQDMCLDTAMYCKYGDTRMKPTDIWSNAPLNLRKCKNGNTCHVPAPRGSKTGTQGLKNNTERSVVPPMLINEIMEQLNIKGGNNA